MRFEQMSPAEIPMVDLPQGLMERMMDSSLERVASMVSDKNPAIQTDFWAQTDRPRPGMLIAQRLADGEVSVTVLDPFEVNALAFIFRAMDGRGQS